ncbi:MAG: hypothetical protein AAF218_09410 [Pseudomonadota bacterium]
MQLVLHTGAHYTEQERLIRSVLRNRDRVSGQGVQIPGPGSYRPLLRDTLNAMGKAPAAPDAREVLLDAMLDGAAARRLILSDANFFRSPSTAIQRGVLYPAAADRLSSMASIFETDALEIFVGIRNPAALIPLFHAEAADQNPAVFWHDKGPFDILWSNTLFQIRAALPGVPITVWCTEDLPMIWSQVIRAMLGLADDAKIIGGFDLLATIMTKEGMERFRSYLHSHPSMKEAQKHRAISAFLEKFALDEELEEDVSMAGWSADLIDELTETYDADVETIARIPDVTLIRPWD